MTTGGFEPPLDRLSTCCLCQVGLHGRWSLRVDSNHHLTGQEPAVLRSHYGGELELIPGIEPGRRPYQGRLPLHQISVGANGGTRTRTSRLGRPAGTVTPHSPWFGLWYQSLIPRPNADRWRSPAQEHLSVVKDPTLASCSGDSARIRTRTHEVWRLGCSVQRQNLPTTRRGLSAARRTKTKKAFQGIAPEGLFLDECRAFRALSPPYRARRRWGD